MKHFRKTTALLDATIRALETDLGVAASKSPFGAVPSASLSSNATATTSAIKSTEERKAAIPVAKNENSENKEKFKVKTLAEINSVAKDVFERLDFRVGKLESVEKVPDSEKLYKCKIDVGEAEPRQICAGVQQYIPIDKMTGKIMVAANLKARKLAGIPSQGMVLMASNADHTEVQLLRPADDTPLGERVLLEGFDLPQDRVPTLTNKYAKIIEDLKPFMLTDNECRATVDGLLMTTSKGHIKCADLTFASIS
mmetsp:Transcript_29719/g.33799  ORF Transcript_29719/g.33799 Transcript_29719/m.33799 type:complete len:254 (-) Transcript_29719:187-948(-)